MRKFLSGVSVAAIVACAAILSVPSAQAVPEEKAATTPKNGGAVKCGKLLDVRTGKLLNDQVVVFDANGVVTAVGPAGSPMAAGGVTITDLSSATCLPGLIDVHTHITGDPSDGGYASLGISTAQETVHGVKNARVTLHAGFTTVRNVGASGYTDVAVRDGVNEGMIEGPRMIVSGPPLGITGGHCDDNLLAYEFHHRAEGVADGPWAARAKVRETVKYGADVIKVCASGGVLSKGDQPGTPQYTLEELKAIVEEAHKLGRKVAAHAHGTQSINQTGSAHLFLIDCCGLVGRTDLLSGDVAREIGFQVAQRTVILRFL